ncbi:MAG TPA: Fe-S cluster assembly protein SufD [Gemmatimonadales bacterium]|nr:Fe-S cluster assembly protein SufD [Gemmatimonadales bacterium]
MTEPYVRQFEAVGGNGGGDGPSWLPRVRRAAMDRFATVGFPSSRDEEWRFTPVSPIAQTDFRPAAPAKLTRSALQPFLFGHPEWPQLVFVNGKFAPDLSVLPSLPLGVRLGNLATALAGDTTLLERHLTRHAAPETTPFAALNTAFIRDGALVYVPVDTALDRPVHLLFVTSPDAGGTVAHPRNLIIVERGAKASVVESYVSLAGGATYFTNAVTEVVSGENAWTEHTRIQRESERAYHVGLTHVDQARGSHYRSFTLAMGGAIARHNLHVRLNAPGIETLMYGLYLTHGDQLVDNHTAIYHDHPECNSWEVYKGVLDDRSRAVFNGKVFVKPEAQKTDAKQTNRNLLLSSGAKVDTKPQLEIFADDVKCTHGATVGFLDPAALFYLRSRGLPPAVARKVLTYAFAGEVVNEVALEPVRRELDRLVLARLGYPA